MTEVNSPEGVTRHLRLLSLHRAGDCNQGSSGDSIRVLIGIELIRRA